MKLGSKKKLHVEMISRKRMERESERWCEASRSYTNPTISLGIMKPMLSRMHEVNPYVTCTTNSIVNITQGDFSVDIEDNMF